MADAKKCDVCGKLYDHKLQFPDFGRTQAEQKEREKYYKKEGRPITGIDISTCGLKKHYDLCPECGEKLRDCLGREVTNIH